VSGVVVDEVEVGDADDRQDGTEDLLAHDGAAGVDVVANHFATARPPHWPAPRPTEQ
jgi:hypothetical protein